MLGMALFFSMTARRKDDAIGKIAAVIYKTEKSNGAFYDCSPISRSCSTMMYPASALNLLLPGRDS